MAFQNTDDYIASFTGEVQQSLQKIRTLVKKEAPYAKEALIYGVPGFKLNGKNLIVYAAFKKHIGLYPEPIAIKHFKHELAVYETSKGAIQFPFEKPIPYALITKIIRFKVNLYGQQ